VDLTVTAVALALSFRRPRSSENAVRTSREARARRFPSGDCDQVGSPPLAGHDYRRAVRTRSASRQRTDRARTFPTWTSTRSGLRATATTCVCAPARATRSRQASYGFCFSTGVFRTARVLFQVKEYSEASEIVNKDVKNVRGIAKANVTVSRDVRIFCFKRANMKTATKTLGGRRLRQARTGVERSSSHTYVRPCRPVVARSRFWCLGPGWCRPCSGPGVFRHKRTRHTVVT